MCLNLNRIKAITASAAFLLTMGGCSNLSPSMKLKRASFNRCIYHVDERNVCWDVRAFIDDRPSAKGEEFIIAMNLVVEDYEQKALYPRIFKIKKVEVYFGTDKVYEGKDFDHQDWLGPSQGSSSNMLRLSEDLVSAKPLSVVLYTLDDIKRTYHCEAGGIKIGSI